ncbi:hypothetical protein HELRODRAFT_156911 [Helobdella robusta]|uniref:cystathionine gamma-lyase n=1 Tax=Helobdella robusta TaxID=6412 RepID=T1EM31_HELRO|nr:hypothetical protein HELRODRAFT_156911 [Helobdella robusta]ESO04973.1 hypothetical protein HELRODRAFT_156911 [Helobdella robusta]
MAIHEGQSPEQWKCGSVVPIISLSSTYQLDHASTAPEGKYFYSRIGNPTRTVAERCVAALENAKYCYLFGSGSAAMVAMCHVLKSGDHIICMDDVYGGWHLLFLNIITESNVEATFVDATDINNIKSAIKPNTKMLWLETPTNPTLKVVDIEAASAVAHQQPGVIVVVDNTFMSSYFQRPLELGADVSLQSLTKYMNGHTDVVMGSVSVNDDELGKKLKFLQASLGVIPSPFDCYLLNRGLKTLALRMRQHMKNGLQVARYLQGNPRVEKVIHPGLPDHPNYDVSMKQCRGFSGMVSFYIRGGMSETQKFFSYLKLFKLAVSLGGYESLAELPATMTHTALTEEERLRLGMTDNFIRLSIGLEDVEDLIEDLSQALEKAVVGKC